MSDYVTKNLAEVVLLAAEMHEESYDVKRATAELRRGLGDEMSLIDASRFYRTSIEDAAKQACKTRFVDGLDGLVSLILQIAWNDVLDWATEVTNPTPVAQEFVSEDAGSSMSKAPLGGFPKPLGWVEPVSGEITPPMSDDDSPF